MKNEFKYISDISTEHFVNEVALPFINEEGRQCILVRNNSNKQNTERGSTDNLEYHLNSIFYHEAKPYYFHMISCLKDDTYSKEQFAIIYEYLFKPLKEPQSDFEIRTLIGSLEQFFKVTSEKDVRKLHTGVYGELLFVLCSFENGIKKILDKYHNNFFSKHDVEITRTDRIEVKSTVSSRRIHHFSHDQIVRKDINVFVASVLLEESSEGVSLNELFDEVFAISNSAEANIWLGKLKGYCGISKENRGPAFSFDKAKGDLKIFEAVDLPHLLGGEQNGITNISYDVDCSLASDILFSQFVEIINSLISEKI